VQRSDENDDSQWGNGRAIKSIAGRVGRDVISFRPRVCPYHATHTNTENGDTRHSLIHGIRDDCMHGIKAELCKHAEAEDFASRNKRSFLTYGARGVGLSLDGIRLGATARAKPRPVCPKIHLKPVAAATEDLARAWLTHARKERHPAPLILFLCGLTLESVGNW